MSVNNSLAKTQKISLGIFLSQDAAKKQINNLIGSKNGPRFISSLLSAVKTTPALQECTNTSLLNAALLGESLQLSPSPQLGQFYMVPYDRKARGHKDKATGRWITDAPAAKEAQFQLGYKGYIQLAERSGQYKKLNVLPIKEGELVKFDPLNEEIVVKLIEDEEEREAAPTAGYYAMFEYTNGFRKAMYWSKKKMLNHAMKYSQAFARNGGGEALERLEAGTIPESEMWKYSSFWFKDFDGMAQKTMLRQLISKWGIMSIELRTAFETDMGVINQNGAAEYVDNVEQDSAGEQSTEIVDEAPRTPDAPVADGPAEPEEDDDPTAGFFNK